jgi:hypothetical protein
VLCPPYPAILLFGTSTPKQHRSNRFEHTLHTTASQEAHDVYCSAAFLIRCGQSPNKIQTRRVCSNRAATRGNLLKCWDKYQSRNTIVCRYFASSRNLQQTIVLPSHGRGRWFEPSIAHSQNMGICREKATKRRRPGLTSGHFYTSAVKRRAWNELDRRRAPDRSKGASGEPGALIIQPTSHTLPALLQRILEADDRLIRLYGLDKRDSEEGSTWTMVGQMKAYEEAKRNGKLAEIRARGCP